MAFLAVKDLDQIAGGLNIEGGFPAHELMKTCGHPNQTLWANLILVLDRPLIDQVIFDEIVKNKSDHNYPLLENAIEEINECHFMVGFYMIIAYYLKQGHQLTQTPINQTLGLTIHVHQDRNCHPLIELIQNMVTHIIDNNPDLQTREIQVSYRSDDPSYADAKTDKNYKGTNILLSFSQCAGLDRQYATGSLLLSSTFVPYDIDNREIRLHSEYHVENDLIGRIEEIIMSSSNAEAVDYVKTQYRSANQVKLLRDSPQLMTLQDFPQTKILQVNQLWNPLSENELVPINMSIH